MSDEWIRLLSEKPLCDYTPADYRLYVRSLYFKPPPKKATKKEPKPFSWTLTKKGTLTIRVNRKPKWLTREEIDQIARESGQPANEVWIKVLSPKSGIEISTKEIQAALSDLPW